MNLIEPTSVLLALLALSGAWAASASAQPTVDVGLVRPIRLEGYWDRSRAERDVIGELTVSADGRTRRSFGVTALQAYNPEEEGLQVLRHSTLQPVNLLLRGREEMVRRFLEAEVGEKVTAFGIYRGGSGTLTLSSVELEKVETEGGATPTR